MSTGPAEAGQNSAIAMSFPTPSNGKPSATGRPLAVPPRPTLVTDFSSYNTDLSPQGRLDHRLCRAAVVPAPLGGRPDVSCRVDVRQADRTVSSRADQGGRVQPVRTRSFDRPGDARTRSEDLGQPVHTPINTEGTHLVTFANVDDRLTLVVDGLLPFGDGTAMRV